MKVVHSFASKELIWKELLYTQMLSALYAKKHYNNIHFYGTKSSVDQVLAVGIPYTTVNESIVENNDGETFSIPKIKVFKSIKEPFLHIDTDTLIIEKINFNRHNSPFLFSHPDITISHHVDGMRKSLNELVTNSRSYDRPEKRFYYDFNNTYLNLFFKLKHFLSDEVVKSFDLGSIPNMNIVLVNDWSTFNQACELTLQHYSECKSDIDKEEFGACYIEQLILHLNLRALSQKYSYMSNVNEHTLFTSMPFEPGPQHNLVPEVDKIQYPFEFTIPNITCECCGSKVTKKHKIDSRKDFAAYFDFDFHGFFHTTFMKWHQHFQAIIINKIVEEFGEEYVLKIHNYFLKEYPQYNLPLISGGEKFYEEITGNKIFTK